MLIATSIGVGSKKLLTIETHFSLVHTWIKESNAGPEYMQIISPGGNITLKAESAEIRNKWAEDINAAITALCKDDNFAKCKHLRDISIAIRSNPVFVSAKRWHFVV